jgi:NitT/TauT family transport system permease protein
MMMSVDSGLAKPPDGENPVPGVAPARGGGRPGWVWELALRFVILGILLAFWQWLGQFGIGVNWVSSPMLVTLRLVRMVGDGSLARNTIATLEETLLGLVIGILAGVAGGILISRTSPLLARAIDPYLMGAYSLPRVALAPFFILWFGIGLVSKVVLVVSVVGFIVLFNVRQGIETVDADIVDVLRSMRASRWEMTRYVVIPWLVPWILSSVKISVGIAFVSAVVGELVGSTKGLGWYVTQSLNQFDMTGGVTSLIIMAVLALVLYGAVGVIERRLVRWRGNSSGAKTIAM